MCELKRMTHNEITDDLRKRDVNNYGPAFQLGMLSVLYESALIEIERLRNLTVKNSEEVA